MPRIKPEHCQELFSAARSYRFATVGADGAPHLVPVTAAVDGDTVVFAVDFKPKKTPHLQRLLNVEHEPRVAFLADHYVDDWTQLWWVRADAAARVVTDGPDLDSALALLMAKYPQYRDAVPPGPALVATVTSWTGWVATATGGQNPPASVGVRP